MFDSDRFKQVNDTHGHDGAEAELKAVAASLVRVQALTLDLVGRPVPVTASCGVAHPVPTQARRA